MELLDHPMLKGMLLGYKMHVRLEVLESKLPDREWLKGKTIWAKSGAEKGDAIVFEGAIYSWFENPGDDYLTFADFPSEVEVDGSDIVMMEKICKDEYLDNAYAASIFMKVIGVLSCYTAPYKEKSLELMYLLNEEHLIHDFLTSVIGEKKEQVDYAFVNSERIKEIKKDMHDMVMVKLAEEGNE